MSRFKPLLQLLFIAVILKNDIGVLAVCPQGYFEANGLCLQQTAQCPANYIYMNGYCFPAVSGQCGYNQFSVNGRCCSHACVQSCQNQQVTCNCCGQPMQNVAPIPSYPQVTQPSPCSAATPCPQNQVVATPYATAPYQQAIQPSPCSAATPCPQNQVVATPCATAPYQQAIQPSPCSAATPCPQNQVVATPCATAPYQQAIQPSPCSAATPCPQNQVVAAPCPSQTTTPCQQVTQPCPNQAAAPCANQPATPCQQPIQPIPAPCQNLQPPVTPYPTIPPPVTPYPTLPPIATTTPPPYTTQPPLYTTRPTSYPTPPPLPPIITTTPPPAFIIKCPDGTVLINGICRMIYCGKGIYRDNHCIETECPEGTVWSGIRCELPQPIEHSITFHNTVLTEFNHTQPDVIVNNVNNYVLNNTISVDVPSPQATTPCENNENDENDCETTPDEPPPAPQTYEPTPAPLTYEPPQEQPKCCFVVSPRTCRFNQEENRSYCYNRRYRRCGDFCIAPTIYLKIDEPRQVPPYTYMPPNPQFANCRQQRTCPESENFHDCSGCAMGRPESCSSYCYNSPCGTRKCSYYDQRQYCSNNPGQSGCQEQDGCYGNSCSGGY